MTREELIARIEAGDTGPDIVCALVKELMFPVEVDLDALLHFGVTNVGLLNAGIPDWLHSLDAAVALVGDTLWTANSEGSVGCYTDGKKYVHFANVPNNVAAALVAAWLKARQYD